jgi:hypothetical protein
MRINYQQPLLYGSAIALLLVSLGGCALRRGYDEPQLRIGKNVNLYAMFDNSRDWGPSYLVEPPDHHFGYGARVDDSRSDLIPQPHRESRAWE